MPLVVVLFTYMHSKKFYLIIFVLASASLFASCSRMGWGVLLWSNEDPPIVSGTVLPVYIRSNIEQIWVTGVPEIYGKEKIEIPLAQLAFAGSKRKAVKLAEEFSSLAASYAENLQDGLPIRENTDNNARRVYRLRTGEIVKILEKVEGNPPVGASGDPLPGDWYKVLTQSGVTGYCFSYRLKLFEHTAGSSLAAPAEQTEVQPDTDLDMVMSRKWSPEIYLEMINSKQINIGELQKKYRFDLGNDSGTAKIILPGFEKEFAYTKIVKDGDRVWQFEGTDLQMELRSNTILAVQYIEDTGFRRTLLFHSLSSDIDDIIVQENARREMLFQSIYNQGPVFTSNNYGSITFSQAGGFTWTDFDLLIPHLISPDVRGEGRVLMDLFISESFKDRYLGALTFRFTGSNTVLRFMYNIDNQGLRLEVVPDFAVEGIAVTRRASSPTVLYFYKDSSNR